MFPALMWWFLLHAPKEFRLLVIQPTKHLCTKVHDELMTAVNPAHDSHVKVCRLGVTKGSDDEYPHDILEEHIQNFMVMQKPETFAFIKFLNTILDFLRSFHGFTALV